MSLLGVFSRALGAPLVTSGSTLLRGVADAIVILGAPLGPDGQLSLAAEERVRVGAELYARGVAPVVCVVGGHCPRGQRDGPAEAEGMARWVREHGVPEEALRIDRLSTSTWTNALRAAEILLPEGRRRVVVVTQPFHLRRALFYFRRVGFEARGFLIEDSIQYRSPWVGLRWIAREYAAWALVLRNVRQAAWT
jgi:uncharacterized SAM-binding protein YcdF (DUF218 family)